MAAVEALSPKQLDHVLEATARINIADGPVRAGKTVANNVRWLEYIENGPPGSLAMAGKTIATLQRNVLDDLQATVGIRNWRRGTENGVSLVRVRTSWGWRKIYLFGANDNRAEDKIRGSTLAGVYLNEVSLYPPNVFKQFLARCSVPGAKIFGDTNPDGPYHWLNKEYLENKELITEGVIKRFRYKLEDNIFLDPQYVEDLKRLYTGVWYKRMILGLWVAAEGAIYDMWNDEAHIFDEPPVRILRRWIGVDYGTANPFVALEMGLGDDYNLYVLREWRWDSRAQGRQMTDKQYSDALKGWLDNPLSGRTHYERMFYDPSAASFGVQLWQDGFHHIGQADNEVLDGIRSVGTLLALGKLRVHRSCKGLIEEMSSYVWDPKAQEKGEDAPLKVNDHGPDALRYLINGTRTVWAPLIRKAA